jgi:zinc transport system substrate-binding protein
MQCLWCGGERRSLYQVMMFRNRKQRRTTWARAFWGWSGSLVLGWSLAAAAIAGDAPKVVTSIVPVHALVAGVTEGVARPTLLLRGTGSPHGGQLKPSDASALAAADIVFWIGPALEQFLVRPLESLAGSALVVSLSDANGIVTLPARPHEIWYDEAEESHADHADRPDSIDPHIWLLPANARAMVTTIASSLAALDPANGEIYHRNEVSLHALLWDLERELEATLSPVRDIPFVVLHDAYQYYEFGFGLRTVTALTIGPDRGPGVRHIRQLATEMERVGARCLFGEVGVSSPLVARLAHDWDLRSGELDPLGLGRADGPAGYFDMMKENAASLVGCLSAAR